MLTVGADTESFVTPALATGVHTLVVRGRTATESSLPLFITETLDVPVADASMLLAPEDLGVTSMTPITATWTNPSAYDSIVVEVDGEVVATPVPLGANSVQSVDLGSVDPGYHDVSVRGFALIGGTSWPTVAVTTSLFVPIPPPGRAFPVFDAVSDIVAMTHDTNDGLFVLNTDGVLTQKDDINGMGTTVIATSGLPPGLPTGIDVEAGTLYWMFDGTLWSSPATGGAAFAVGSVYPDGEGIAGDIATLGSTLWVVDALNNRITSHDIVANSVSALTESVIVPGNPLGVATRGARVEVLVDIDGANYTVLLNADGSLDSSLAVESPNVAPAFAAVSATSTTDRGFLVSSGELLYQAPSLDPLPAPGEENCHTMGLAAQSVTATSAVAVTSTTATSLSVDGSGVARDVDVMLSWTQVDPGLITMLLTSPQGTTVTILSEFHAEQLEFQHRFDDLDIPGDNDFVGTRSAAGSLAGFDGESVTGSWTLTVEDPDVVGGTLIGWGVDICLVENPAPTYIRGDLDGSGALALNDVIFLLNYLFLQGAVPSCLAAGDADANGSTATTDAIYFLQYMFQQGPPPLAPFPTCGADPNTTLRCDPSC